MRAVVAGLSVVEILAIVVILGILAATAIPHYTEEPSISVSALAHNVAGKLESASAVNHASDIAVEANLGDNFVVTIDNCKQAMTLISGSLPERDLGAPLFELTDKPVGNKATVTCEMVHLTEPGKVTRFTLIGACANDAAGIGEPCAPAPKLF